MGFKSHSDCIVDCKAQYFHKRYNRWHPYIPVAEDVTEAHYLGKQSLASNKTLDKVMSEACAQRCGKKDNCFNEYFDIKIVEKWNNSETDGSDDKLFEIIVYLPTEMTVKYTHSPRLKFAEYLCYLASIFNLWFGISIITCSKFIFGACHYFRRKGEEPEENQTNNSKYCFLYTILR